MHLDFFIPGDLNTLTGGYIYDKKIVEGLKRIGHHVAVHLIPGNFPFPTDDDLVFCQKEVDAIPKGNVIILDSLIFGAIPEILSKARAHHPIVAIIHLPISHQENHTDQNAVAEREFRALLLANRIVVTSPFSKNLLITSGIHADIIDVIIPGVEVLLTKNSYSRMPFRLLTIANYTSNKGYLLLIEALREISHLHWVLHCYGNKHFDLHYAESLLDLIVSYDLQNRIFLHDAISGSDLSQAYATSDILIHPSGFETYGMVLSEALAHGIPVMASDGGAIPDTVPSSMGVFFKAGDQASFGITIQQLLEDPGLYHQLCSNVFGYRSKMQLWEITVSDFEKSLRGLL